MTKRKPTAPTDAANGAASIKAAMVELFDRKDGTGADWPLMVESIFRAGFELADDRLDSARRQAFFRRIHEGSYRRISAEEFSAKAELPVADVVGKDFARLEGQTLNR